MSDKEKSVIARYGLIVGVWFSLVALVGIYLFVKQGIESPFIVNCLFLFAQLFAVIYPLYNFRKYVSDGPFTFGKGLKVSSGVGLLAGVIEGAVRFLVYTFDTEFVAMTKELLKKSIAMMGLSPDQSNAMLQSTEMAVKPWVIFFSTVLNDFVFCVIVGLICMLFLREKPSYDDIMKNID